MPEKFDSGKEKGMTTVTFDGNLGWIDKIITPAQRIAQPAFKDCCNIEVVPGDVVRLYCDELREWACDGIGNLGTGSICCFSVPKDATGSSELMLESFVVFEKYRINYLHLDESKGWAKDIRPFLTEEKEEGKKYYEVRGITSYVPFDDQKLIKPGFSWENQKDIKTDMETDLIAEYSTLELAEKHLEKIKTDIYRIRTERHSFIKVIEYFIQDEDGRVLHVSKME